MFGGMTCRSTSLALLWLLISTTAPATSTAGDDDEPCPTSADVSPNFCEDYYCSHVYLTSKKCYCTLDTSHRITAARPPWLLQTTTQGQACTPDELRNALLAFQNYYGLPPSGLCDHMTRSMILNPSCEWRDTNRNSNEEQLKSLSHRALSSILRASGQGATTDIHSKKKRQVRHTFLEAQTPPLDDVNEQNWLYSSDVSSEEHVESKLAWTDEDEHPSRSKRQQLPNISVNFSTNTLRYRIISYSSRLAAVDQDAAFTAAFRQWASITPLCFIRDTTSDISSIQLKIGFYDGYHSGDTRPFGLPGGEMAHTLPGVFTHLDNSQDWYTSMNAGYETGISLYSVALHEIGHLIGLPHLGGQGAVMFPYYNSTRPATVVSNLDRTAALSKYGPCNGSFNVIIDVLYSVPCIDDDGEACQPYRYFSSYFFRGSYVWFYRNSLGRAYDNQPQPIAVYWTGLPNNLDGMCEFSSDTHDIFFAFKGSTVYLFNYTLDRAGYVYASYPISQFFPNGSIGEPIPNNIDSCYFDPRDGNLYFFKYTWVYVYAYNPQGPHSCCVAKYDIKARFPPAIGDEATVSGLTYQQNVDAVYISVYFNTQYFFVQNQVWKNENFDYYDSNANNNSVVYMGPWNSYWGFICDVVC